MTQQPRRRTDQLIAEDIRGECVIYDERQKKAHHLNATLAWIWHRCDGNTSLEAMAAAFERQFDVVDGLDIVTPAVKQLEACELLEAPIDLPELATGATPEISRRAAVAGGSILLPALVSMIAPTPAAAKSQPEHTEKYKYKYKDKPKVKDKD